jgi:Mn-dependent DtxR family transcriptional regulator
MKKFNICDCKHQRRRVADMDKGSSFYTFKGYQLNNNEQITSSMEDYLEMISRMLKTKEVVRISELAEKLHVKPSSASKMAGNLKYFGLVIFEKYGYIKLTDAGEALGEYLLYRHDVLDKFLRFVNNSENETEQVEKIEHFLNEKTIRNIERLVKDLYAPQT